MKYLIQYTYSIKSPWYLLPNFIRGFIGQNKYLGLLRFGIGSQDKSLFKQKGYDGTEITAIITGIFDKPWELDESRIEKFKTRNIEVLHAPTSKDPFKSIEYDDLYLNLSDDSEYSREGIEACILLAKYLILDSPQVNFHPGFVMTRHKDDAIRALRKNLKFAAELAERHGVNVSLENEYQKVGKEFSAGTDPKLMKELLDEVDSDRLKVCYDWGHANVQARFLYDSGNLSQKELADFTFHKQFIETLGNRLGYAHIHYNLSHVADIPGSIELFYRSEFDKHMPLSKIREEDIEKYTELLKLLKNKTSIAKYGKILLELTRTKLFGVIPFNSLGATSKDALRSLEIVKNIFET